MSFSRDLTNYGIERSELAAWVAVSSSIRVEAGFGNTDKVVQWVPVFQHFRGLDGSLCILWAGLRRTFHDVLNSFYMSWRSTCSSSMISENNGKVALISFEYLLIF